jgi:hypothetical protein
MPKLWRGHGSTGMEFTRHPFPLHSYVFICSYNTKFHFDRREFESHIFPTRTYKVCVNLITIARVPYNVREEPETSSLFYSIHPVTYRSTVHHFQNPLHEFGLSRVAGAPSRTVETRRPNVVSEYDVAMLLNRPIR